MAFLLDVVLSIVLLPLIVILEVRKIFLGAMGVNVFPIREVYEFFEEDKENWHEGYEVYNILKIRINTRFSFVYNALEQLVEDGSIEHRLYTLDGEIISEYRYKSLLRKKYRRDESESLFNRLAKKRLITTVQSKVTYKPHLFAVLFFVWYKLGELSEW